VDPILGRRPEPVHGVLGEVTLDPPRAAPPPAIEPRRAWPWVAAAAAGGLFGMGIASLALAAFTLGSLRPGAEAPPAPPSPPAAASSPPAPIIVAPPAPPPVAAPARVVPQTPPVPEPPHPQETPPAPEPTPVEVAEAEPPEEPLAAPVVPVAPAPIAAAPAPAPDPAPPPDVSGVWIGQAGGRPLVLRLEVDEGRVTGVAQIAQGTAMRNTAISGQWVGATLALAGAGGESFSGILGPTGLAGEWIAKEGAKPSLFSVSRR
jgi:hypothetical protein